MTPNTPPTIKGAVGTAGKEIANIGQAYSTATKGLQNFGAQARATGSQIAGALKGANPYSLKGMYKKAKRK